MAVARRIGLAGRMKNPDDQAAIDELREKVEKDMSTGSAAPSTTTPGNIYFRTGASAGIYYNNDGTWTQVGNVS